MGKHRRSNPRVTRNAAAVSAVALGATAVITNPAQAAEVVIPNTGFSVEVAGIENTPGLNNVPGIDQWIPSLSSQAAPAAYAAVVEAPAAVQAAPAQSNGQAIVDAARSKIGAPYGWGATGPNAFDCSGLTSWAYTQAGKDIPRTSQAQAQAGQQVSRADMQPGDIIVYYPGATHVGLYVGDGKMVDSLGSGYVVDERPVDYMPIHSIVRF